MWSIWCMPFLFAIDAVLDKMIVSFYYACKREKIPCNRLIGTSCWCIFKVSLLFDIACRRWVFEWILQIRMMASLYLMFAVKDKKTKCISNLFLQSKCNDCYAFIWACVTNRVTLSEHVSPIEASWVWKLLE